MVFEPFAGCGTTLVECQKLGFKCVGNESQELMCNIINAKLNWIISDKGVMEGLEAISNYLKENIDTDDLIIVGNKDKDVKVESHEFQKDEK